MSVKMSIRNEAWLVLAYVHAGLGRSLSTRLIG